MTQFLLSNSIRKSEQTKCAPVSNEIKRFALFSFFAILMMTSFSLTTLGQAELLKDLNENPEGNTNVLHQLTDGVGRMYYVDRGDLWISNGTTETTVKL